MVVASFLCTCNALCNANEYVVLMHLITSGKYLFISICLDVLYICVGKQVKFEVDSVTNIL